MSVILTVPPVGTPLYPPDPFTNSSPPPVGGQDPTTDPYSSSSSAPTHIEAIYITIGIVGVLGNALVLAVLFSARGKIRPRLTSRYIANQSAIDLMVSVVLAAGARVDSSHLRGSGQFGMELYCKLWVTKMFLWGLLVSSTYNLTAVTIERYLALVRPMWHHVSFTDTKAYLSMLAIWVFGIGFNAAYMIPTSHVKDGTCLLYTDWPSAKTRDIFGVIVVVLQFFIPLSIIIFCYAHIAYTLKLRSKDLTLQPGINISRSNSVNNISNVHKGITIVQDDYDSAGSGIAPAPKAIQEVRDPHRPIARKKTIWGKARRNTIKTLALVSLCFVLCWICNQVYFTMMNLGYPPDLSSGFYHFTVVAVFTNSCLNPFIYMLQFEQFQDAAKKLFLKRFRSKESPTVSMSLTSTSR